MIMTMLWLCHIFKHWKIMIMTFDGYGVKLQIFAISIHSLKKMDRAKHWGAFLFLFKCKLVFNVKIIINCNCKLTCVIRDAIMQDTVGISPARHHMIICKPLLLERRNYRNTYKIWSNWNVFSFKKCQGMACKF